MQGVGGSQLVTADLAVGTSGKPIRVLSIHILSGGTGGVVKLRLGTAVTDTIWVQETGTANTGATFTYGKYGFLFSSGCFCDIDANVTSCLVEYWKEA